MANKNTPTPLFDLDEQLKWKEEWKDMPEFLQKDESAYQSIIVHFENQEDMEAFSSLIGQKITRRTKSIWYPKYNREKPSNFMYIQEDES